MALTVTASPVSAYQDEDIAWLWPGRIPSGMVTILEGDPGQGKSTVTLDLAARLSTGRPMPGEHGSREPKATLLLSAEDSASMTIRRRLRAAGADLDRVHVLDGISGAKGRERLVELPGDLPALEELIRRLDIALVVVDPLTAFLADNTNATSDHWVRRTLWPVQVAQRTGAAVLVVRHLTKTGGTKAIYRGGGSIDLAGAARAVYLIGADPADEHRKLFARVKLNIAAPPPTLSYRLEEVAEYGCARVVWFTEPVALTAADLLAGPSAPRGGLPYSGRQRKTCCATCWPTGRCRCLGSSRKRWPRGSAGAPSKPPRPTCTWSPSVAATNAGTCVLRPGGCPPRHTAPTPPRRLLTAWR